MTSIVAARATKRGKVVARIRGTQTGQARDFVFHPDPQSTIWTGTMLDAEGKASVEAIADLTSGELLAGRVKWKGVPLNDLAVMVPRSGDETHEWVDGKTAAKRLGLTESRLHQIVKDGSLRAIKGGAGKQRKKLLAVSMQDINDRKYAKQNGNGPVIPAPLPVVVSRVAVEGKRESTGHLMLKLEGYAMALRDDVLGSMLDDLNALIENGGDR